MMLCSFQFQVWGRGEFDSKKLLCVTLTQVYLVWLGWETWRCCITMADGFFCKVLRWFRFRLQWIGMQLLLQAWGLKRRLLVVVVEEVAAVARQGSACARRPGIRARFGAGNTMLGMSGVLVGLWEKTAPLINYFQIIRLQSVYKLRRERWFAYKYMGVYELITHIINTMYFLYML